MVSFVTYASNSLHANKYTYLYIYLHPNIKRLYFSHSSPIFEAIAQYMFSLGISILVVKATCTKGGREEADLNQTLAATMKLDKLPIANPKVNHQLKSPAARF